MKIAVIGAGAMGGATVEGLIKGQQFRNEDITVSDPSQAVLKKFEKTGWKAHKSEVVDAPILDDLPYSLECTLECFKEDYGIIGNVVQLLVDEKYLDASGKVDLEKMQIIAYDPFNHGYYVVGKKVGQAFSEGRKIK